MQDRMPTVSVVIASRNRREMLERVVTRLLADAATGEIVVAVDGSTDGTVQALARIAAGDDRLRWIELDHGGAPAAQTAGAEAATGTIVLVLDDDVVPEPGLVAGHAAAHAAAGPRHVVLGYMPVAEGDRARGRYPLEIYAREYQRTVAAWEADAGAVLRSLWAGNLSMARTDFLEVMTTMPTVTGYHEDLDLGLNCLELGMAGVFDRSLAATHRYARSPEAFLRDARGSGRNLPEIYRRHPAELGDLPAAFPAADLPPAVRPLVRLGGGFAPFRWAVASAVSLCGRLGLHTPERWGGSLLWRFEQVRGVREGA